MENFIRHFTVVGNTITDSRPIKKGGNVGENNVTSLSFTFSEEWDNAIVSIVFRTPSYKLLTPQTVTNGLIEIPVDALDTSGTLQFSLMGAFADSNKVLRTPTYGLEVEATLNILGGTPLATYTNVVLACQLATTSANTASQTANDAAADCRVAEQETKNAEAARVIAESARAEQAESDHQTASGDHDTAATDHATAQSDHTTASTDHTTAQTDHTNALTDRAAITPTINEVQAARGGQANLDARLDGLDAQLAQMAPQLAVIGSPSVAVMTNLLPNGDAHNGTTGWIKTSGSTMTAVDGKIEFTPVAQNNGIFAEEVSIISGHTYYTSQKVQSTTTNVRLMLSQMVSPYSYAHIGYTDGLNTLKRYSSNIMATFSGAGRLNAQDKRTTGFDKITVDEFMLIDLTAHFGAGSEPSAATMDWLLGFFSNPYVSVNAPLPELLKAMLSVYHGEYRGKKWAVMGDSLTEHNVRTLLNYHDYVASDLGLTVINMGDSGTGFMKMQGSNLAYYQRIASIASDVNVVTIMGSGNDLTLFASLGDVTDVGTTTICGCINATIDALYTALPTVRLGMIAPTPWGSKPPTTPGNEMEVYCDKIQAICKMRGIPYLDLYHNSGLRPWEAAYLPLIYSRDEGNSVHPDENGHKLIAGHVREFVKALLSN